MGQALLLGQMERIWQRGEQLAARQRPKEYAKGRCISRAVPGQVGARTKPPRNKTTAKTTAKETKKRLELANKTATV